MKKTRFLLAAMLLVTMFTFTGCGNQDDKNNDAIPDNQQNQTVQQDEENAAGDVRDDADKDADKDADDIRDDADEMGDDVKDGIDDAADDVKDALDGDDEVNNHNRNEKDQTGENMGQ